MKLNLTSPWFLLACVLAHYSLYTRAVFRGGLRVQTLKNVNCVNTSLSWSLKWSLLQRLVTLTIIIVKSFRHSFRVIELLYVVLLPLGDVCEINFRQLSDGFHLKNGLTECKMYMWKEELTCSMFCFLCTCSQLLPWWQLAKFWTFHYYTFPAGDPLNHNLVNIWSIAVKFSQQTGLGKIFASKEKKWYLMIFMEHTYPHDFWNF